MATFCRGLIRLFSRFSFFSVFTRRKSASTDKKEELKGLIRDGDGHLKDGNLDPALKAYTKAARIDPGSSAEKKSALVLGMMGRYMEAIAAIDRAIEIDPSDAEAWMHRGFLFLRLERKREAVACFERAIALDPGNDYARFCRTETAEEIKRAEVGSRRAGSRRRSISVDGRKKR